MTEFLQKRLALTQPDLAGHVSRVRSEDAKHKLCKVMSASLPPCLSSMYDIVFVVS